LSVVMISSLGSHSQTILKDNYRSVLAAQRMKEAAERLEDIAALSLLAVQQHEGPRQALTYRQQFEHELQVQEGNITEAGEREVTQQLRVLWTGYQEQLDHLQEIGDADTLKQFYFTKLEPMFQAVRNAADAILAINQDSMVRKSEEVR